jgi:hypothetical protein
MTSRLQPLHLSDFTGGLVTKQPPTEIEINQSPDCDNINLLKKGFKKRQGDLVFNSTAMNSGANIQGLAYYRPISGTKYLVAIAGNKIFKSDALDGTMDDITGGLSITAGANNIWTTAALNDLVIFVGGAPDAPIKWSGAGNAAVVADTPPNGNFCFQMRDRIHIGNTSANPNQMAHCVLADPDDWSGTGSGTTDVVTNDGDVLIGGMPLNNEIAILFKRFSMHYYLVGGISNLGSIPVKPMNVGMGACGKHAIVKAEGLIYFITPDARMKATDGHSIINFPDSVDDLWDDVNKSRLDQIFGVYYPTLRQIHWYVSKGSTQTTNDYAIIWDIQHKAWLRHTTGYDVNVAVLADGYRLFGGQYDGKLYEKDSSDRYEDDSETDPGIITGYWNTKWFNFGDNTGIKHPRQMDITPKAQTTQNLVKWSYGFNFNKDLKMGQFETNVDETGGLWDVDTWNGSFVWGGKQAVNVQKKIFMRGRGNNFQIKLFNDVYDQQFQIDSLDILLDPIPAVKELSNV